MSVTAMSKTFWTEFPPLSYKDKKGKIITIKNATAKIVLLAIADNADDFGENSYQSFETLARKTSIDRRSVIRVIRALVNSGFLVVAGISNYGTNNYSVIIDKLGEAPKKRAKTGRPKTSDSESPLYKTSDSVAKSSDSDAQTSDSVAKSSDPESPESSLNHSLPIHETNIDPKIYQAWESAKEFIKPDTPRMSFDQYVSKTRAINYADGILEVEVQSEEAISWLEDRVRPAAERYLIGPMNSEVSVSFITGGVNV